MVLVEMQRPGQPGTAMLGFDREWSVRPTVSQSTSLIEQVHKIPQLLLKRIPICCENIVVQRLAGA